jgi:hypothetical protein
MWDWITEKWDLIEWGTVMEFFAAVGTVGALLVAYRLLRREAGRDEERARERRSDQARLVAAWVRIAKVRKSAWTQQGWQPEDYEVRMLNSSPSPVYDVRLIYAVVDEEGGRVGMGATEAPILPPEESSLDLPPDMIAKWKARKATHPTLVVDIEFTDGVGRRWRRTYDGVLTDLTDAKDHAPARS